jgi:hypothetical protein
LDKANKAWLKDFDPDTYIDSLQKKNKALDQLCKKRAQEIEGYKKQISDLKEDNAILKSKLTTGGEKG